MVSVLPQPVRLVLLALLLLPLCACAGGSEEFYLARPRNADAAQPFPVNYRAELLAFMRTYLNDPTGIRDAAVSEPEIKTFDSNNRYLSCLRYTARRAAGQSASPRESLVLFLDGRLDRIVDNAREFCKGAAYQPFPELERLTR
jgi:hypothetical protein